MFRYRLGYPAAALAALVCLAGAACSAPGSSSSPAAAGGGSTPSGPIKIAVVDAQSGSASDLGQFEYRGVKLAVDQVNAAGGVDGRKIALSLLDDQGDPTVGTELARKIASQGDIAMLGTAESAVTLAMAPILQSEHIPNITSGQSTKLLAVNSPYLFLNGPTGLTYDSTLAKYLVQTKGYKKIAMLTNNDSYGAGEHDAFTSSLKTLGVTPVADKVVPQDQTNMTPALNAHPRREPAGPVHRRGGGAVRADGQAGPGARPERGHRRGRPGGHAAVPVHRRACPTPTAPSSARPTWATTSARRLVSSPRPTPRRTAALPSCTAPRPMTAPRS